MLATHTDLQLIDDYLADLATELAKSRSHGYHNDTQLILEDIDAALDQRNTTTATIRQQQRFLHCQTR
jgi:hypothetical protein